MIIDFIQMSSLCQINTQSVLMSLNDLDRAIKNKSSSPIMQIDQGLLQLEGIICRMT